MSQPHTEESNASHSCGCGSACGSESIELAQPQPEPVGIPVFRIPTMDCAVEESRVAAAGGRVHKSKWSIGQYGNIALVTDTEGNMLGLHSM